MAYLGNDRNIRKNNGRNLNKEREYISYLEADTNWNQEYIRKQ